MLSVKYNGLDYMFTFYEKHDSCPFLSRNYSKRNFTQESCARALRTIKAIARLNGFNYMFTLTADKRKVSRNEDFIRAVRVALNNYKMRYDSALQYIFIPEMHESGDFHVHGLIKLSEDNPDLVHHATWDKVHYKRIDYLRSEYFYRNFGANRFCRIYSTQGAVDYCVEYVTKDLETLHNAFNRLYFCSKGLQRTQTIARYDDWQIEYYFKDLLDKYCSSSCGCFTLTYYASPTVYENCLSAPFLFSRGLYPELTGYFDDWQYILDNAHTPPPKYVQSSIWSL